MNHPNEITRKLKIEYPIIQAPMFGVTTPEMVAAAASVGCLGSLPFADLPIERCREITRKTKQLTGSAFAVNLFVYDIPDLTASLKIKYNTVKLHIEKLAAEHGIQVKLTNIDDLHVTTYHQQLEVIIEEKIPIVSFTFGNMDEPTINQLKNAGVTLIGTCTSVEEAKMLAESGIDILCVQGWEAGGHRGSFRTENVPMIGGFALLAKVVETVNVPVIYAGGIYNSQMLQAAEKLGARGFQIGSLLMGSKESAFKEFEKRRLRKVKESDIMLTKSFTGRYARGLRNAFIEAIENTDYILPYPYQNSLTSELRKAAREANNPDFVNIWAGQGINSYNDQSTADILQKLIDEVNIIS
jgi:nitronate monooxygenase